MRIPRLRKIINCTYRYFWSKTVNNLQLRLTRNLEWKEIPHTIKLPITIRVHKPVDDYNHNIEFNAKNVEYISHSMTLRNYDKRIKVAALDPGIRTFQTLYDTDNVVIEFGVGDIYNGIVDIPKVHNGLCKYLIDNYNVVLIPRLYLKNTTDPNYRKWCHLEFIDKLKRLSKYTNCNVVEVEESWTSKTCTNCGSINDPGYSKTYNCIKCGLEIDRDFNGARNILIKNMDHIGLWIRRKVQFDSSVQK